MPKLRLHLFLWMPLIAAVVVVQANYERANTGIKTSSYRHDPLNAPPVHDQQQQYNRDYQTRNIDAYGERLSPIQNNFENNNNRQQLPKEQYEQGISDNQQEVPLYNRQNRQFSTQTSVAENAITEYYSTCPFDHTGQLAYVHDCHRFLNCWHGQGHIQSCSAGTAFNPKTLQCDRAEKVDCNSLGLLAGLQQQKPPQASNNRNANYRTERLQDVYAEPPKNVVCSPGIAGLQPHPTDCTQFLNCANGNAFIQKCGPGTAYSIQMMTCDHKHKVDCSGRNENSDGSSANKLASSNDIMCLPQVSGNFPYPFDYTKFFNCKNGNTAIQNCATGMAFSITQGFCDSRDKVPSNERVQYIVSEVNYEYAKSVINCPPGMDGLHLYPFESVKYIQCYNGQLKILNCAPQTVFSITRRMCLPKHQIDPNDHVRPMSEIVQHLSTPLAAMGPNSNIRDPKSYDNQGRTNYQQERGQYAPRTSENRDRWSTMNMQRPVAEREGTSTWSGSDYSTATRQNPTQHVLQVEGSLQPDSNYEESVRKYSVPLAPLVPYSPSATTTTTTTTTPSSKIYYTQPVGSNEDSKEIFTNPHGNNFDSMFLRKPPFPSQPTHSNRQNQSREISNPWRPIAKQNPHPSSPNPSQQEIDESFAMQHTDQGQVQQQLDSFGNVQQPSNTNFRPPLSPTPSSRSLLPTIPNQVRNPNNPTYLAPFDNPYPNSADDTNLHGELQPPKLPQARQQPTPDPNENKNVRVFQLYPPLENATVQKNLLDPHYSQPYAGIAHSRNETWPNDGIKAPQHSTATTQFAFNNEGKLVPVENLNENQFSPTTDRRDVSASPYSRHFYESTTPVKQNTETEITDDNDKQLPINDAIRMLLRPYFNRSGTVKEDEAKKAESHIMKLVGTQPTITTTPGTTTPRQDDEVELIFAGEQDSLTTTRKSSTAPPNEQHHNSNFPQEHKRDFHHRQPHSRTQFGDEERSSVDQPRKKLIHNKEFHLRHPNLPNPFNNNDEWSNGFNKPMHHHYHRHQHSRDYHQKHPNLPNPFATREVDISDEDDDDVRNPNAESTTPVTQDSEDYIDVRFRKTEENCQFDCGNGKCINKTQVCDGVNNCGNRNDETNCDHLGYEVRLTAGESPNMGRVEVKISGKWGCVCDDRFGLLDADVVCKELGFKLGADEVRGNSYYPPNEHNASFAMDKVNCKGNETSLKFCEFSGWGVHNCGPEEVVGVVCKVQQMQCPKKYWLCSTSEECIPPEFVCDNTPDCADVSDESDAICKAAVEYRLEGGRSDIEGRIEVKYRGKWGTVCNDDFGLKEAQVVCNSLGFYGEAKIEKKMFGPGNGPIWLDFVSCVGDEDAIDKCAHWPWGEHNCNHTEDIGIRCSVGPMPRSALSESDVFRSLNKLEPKDSQDEEDNNSNENIASSSKFMEYQNRCGNFKKNLLDEFEPVERIVKGNRTKRGHHPWQAAIRLKGNSGLSTHSCGAVLISKRHLLTAAHCLAGYPKNAFFVRLGDHYTTLRESSEVDMFIKDWYIHENFRETVHMNNDIALVVLKHAVQFNDYIQPICLPKKNAILQPERMCTVSGWGSIKSGSSTPSNALRAARLPIIADKTCKQTHVYGKSLTENMFCAGFLDGKTDACDGDSGGPLVCADQYGETLYGIISWGKHCGYVNKPGVYVQVGKYIDWIYSKMNYSFSNGRRS